MESGNHSTDGAETKPNASVSRDVPVDGEGGTGQGVAEEGGERSSKKGSKKGVGTNQQNSAKKRKKMSGPLGAV